MKLFHYSAIIETKTVIAAKTQEEADAMWEQIYSEDDSEASRLVSGDCAEIFDISEGRLDEIRDPSRERREGEPLESWLDDDAHIIVPQKASVTT